MLVRTTLIIGLLYGVNLAFAQQADLTAYTVSNKPITIGLEHQLNIYPIPSDDGFITLDFGNYYTEEELLLTVFDLTGSVVQAYRITVGKKREHQLNLSDLPMGTYFLNIAGRDMMISKRIAIKK